MNYFEKYLTEANTLTFLSLGGLQTSDWKLKALSFSSDNYSFSKSVVYKFYFIVTISEEMFEN